MCMWGVRDLEAGPGLAPSSAIAAQAPTAHLESGGSEGLAGRIKTEGQEGVNGAVAAMGRPRPPTSVLT